MYFLIKRVLFLFDPEKVHYFIMNTLRALFKIPGIETLSKRYFSITDPRLSIKLWGIEFPNRVGLAAGFDKNGEYIRELSSFGFGHIEIGTITPIGQEGNPKPRLFRLVQSEGLINRMGFNNHGTEIAINNLKALRSRNCIIGGNIGKNKDTPIDNAFDDYLKSWSALYPHVDYFVVNISSPNTPQLRDLQQKEPLRSLLTLLKTRSKEEGKNKPIVLKISPDLNFNQLDDILDIVQEIGLDGITATNTTLRREFLAPGDIYRYETGGLSGKPIQNTSTEFIRYIYEKTQGKLPIIGVGGIFNPDDALEKIKAGASLVQIYTGFVFEGPSLIKKINQAMIHRLE